MLIFYAAAADSALSAIFAQIGLVLLLLAQIWASLTVISLLLPLLWGDDRLAEIKQRLFDPVATSRLKSAGPLLRGDREVEVALRRVLVRNEARKWASILRIFPPTILFAGGVLCGLLSGRPLTNGWTQQISQYVFIAALCGSFIFLFLIFFVVMPWFETRYYSDDRAVMLALILLDRSRLVPTGAGYERIESLTSQLKVTHRVLGDHLRVVSEGCGTPVGEFLKKKWTGISQVTEKCLLDTISGSGRPSSEIEAFAFNAVRAVLLQHYEELPCPTGENLLPFPESRGPRVLATVMIAVVVLGLAGLAIYSSPAVPVAIGIISLTVTSLGAVWRFKGSHHWSDVLSKIAKK